MAEQMEIDLNGPSTWTKEQRDEAKWRYVYGMGFSVRRLAEWEAWENETATPPRPPAKRDPGTKLWRRPEPDGTETIVANRTDDSQLHVKRPSDGSCWACDSNVAHSTDYHESEFRALYERFHSRRVDEHGTVIFTALSEPEYEDDGGQ